MKIIIQYGKFGEVFHIKGATPKQMIDIRNKIVNSFTKKQLDFRKIQKNIMNSKDVKDLFG